ncbi:MAG: TRAP transporter substrate-binding protein DctP [Gammaproteobacteria bacterium]|nr:TRAP transporter substrate-binding protein DctP [Gammaproteobacteria bacterium]
MNRRNFVKAAVTGAAATSLAVPAIASADEKKKVRLKMQTYWGKEADAQFKEFTDNVKIASDGAIRIKRYPGSAIVPDAEMLEAVSKGTLDMCESYGGYWPGKMDTALVESGMPGAWVDYDQATYLFNAGLTEAISEAYAEKNIKYLGAVMGGAFDLLTNKPVKSLEDLKKMKIRATPNMAKILQKFDIPTVFLPGSELYIALQTGKIDGAIYGGPMEYVGMKLYETAKYYTKLNVLNPGYTDCVLMNMEKWNALSEADQKIMELAYTTHAENMHGFLMSASFDSAYTSKFEFSELPAAESKQLRDAAKVLWDEEAKKSPRVQKAVELIKQFNS